MKILITLTAVFLLSINLTNGQSNAHEAELNLVKRNTLYFQSIASYSLDFSINYGRYLPLAAKQGIVLSSGISLNNDTRVSVEGNYLAGGPHHFFEMGTRYDLTTDFFIFNLGYRFQSSKGILVKIAPVYYHFGDFGLSASLGYAF